MEDIRCNRTFSNGFKVITYETNNYANVELGIRVGLTRADQNTGGALLEFPMRTAMHGKSRVSSCHN